MLIQRDFIPEMTIEDFADKYGLTMTIRERPRPVGDSLRYYAYFDGAEVQDGGCLIATYGDGATEAQAIAAYGKRIALRRLALNATGADRREIDVPRLIQEKPT